MASTIPARVPYAYVAAEDSLPSELVCSVCHEPVRTHRACPRCRNSYCKECVEHWFLTQRGSGVGCSCPYCRKKLRFSELGHDEALQARLDGLEVRCANAAAGFSLVLTVFLGALAMFAVALAVNNLHPGRRYPSQWVGRFGVP